MKRQGKIRIEYEIQPIDPFLSADDLESLSFELGIEKWEMNRTHWVVKDVNLSKELNAARGITLPSWSLKATKTVDITKHQFDVGLSFPGEVRATVKSIAQELEGMIGPNSYFYDKNYVSQLSSGLIPTFGTLGFEQQ